MFISGCYTEKVLEYENIYNSNLVNVTLIKSKEGPRIYPIKEVGVTFLINNEDLPEEFRKMEFNGGYTSPQTTIEEYESGILIQKFYWPMGYPSKDIILTKGVFYNLDQNFKIEKITNRTLELEESTEHYSIYTFHYQDNSSKHEKQYYESGEIILFEYKENPAVIVNIMNANCHNSTECPSMPFNIPPNN